MTLRQHVTLSSWYYNENSGPHPGSYGGIFSCFHFLTFMTIISSNHNKTNRNMVLIKPTSSSNPGASDLRLCRAHRRRNPGGADGSFDAPCSPGAQQLSLVASLGEAASRSTAQAFPGRPGNLSNHSSSTTNNNRREVKVRRRCPVTRILTLWAACPLVFLCQKR
jgi:hypothetical protein